MTVWQVKGKFNLEPLVSVIERTGLALPADLLKACRARLAEVRRQRFCRNPLLAVLDDLYELIRQTPAQ